jgi:hypothetical protein
MHRDSPVYNPRESFPDSNRPGTASAQRLLPMGEVVRSSVRGLKQAKRKGPGLRALRATAPANRQMRAAAFSLDQAQGAWQYCLDSGL